MPFVIGKDCDGVQDKACVDVCPVDCIYEFDGESQLFIHPDECIECGACQPVCPVSAIFMDDEMPEGQEKYVQLNADKTAELA
ncbi:MAG: ferredoxin family protein [Cyanobacteria bacterium P01_H01_bin.74]